MEITNKHPKIYLLSGKARNGKDTTAEFLKKFYEADGKKVIYSRAGKYIKFYASEMTGWDGKEETGRSKLASGSKYCKTICWSWHAVP